MGILIPHHIIEELGVKPRQRIHVVVPQKIDWSDIWGRFDSKSTTDRLLKSARTRRD